MLRRISVVLLNIVISVILGLSISIFIVRFSGFNIFEVMFWIGLLFAGLGILTTTPDPKMIGGCLTNQYLSISLQTQKTSRFNNFKDYEVLRPKASGKCTASAGVLLILIGYFLR